MPTHNGPITVHFHGGFLDGFTSHSGETDTGQITDFWNADTIFFVTKGEVGNSMSGVSPEGWRSMKRTRRKVDRTIDMSHRYRVTASRVEGDRLVIDVAYEVEQ